MAGLIDENPIRTDDGPVKTSSEFIVEGAFPTRAIAVSKVHEFHVALDNLLASYFPDMSVTGNLDAIGKVDPPEPTDG